MNYDAIKKAAEGYRADMAKFLRDMIAIPHLPQKFPDGGICAPQYLQYRSISFPPIRSVCPGSYNRGVPARFMRGNSGESYLSLTLTRRPGKVHAFR